MVKCLTEKRECAGVFETDLQLANLLADYCMSIIVNYLSGSFSSVGLGLRLRYIIVSINVCITIEILARERYCYILFLILGICEIDL
jgi:hypothetical protein